MTDFHFWGVSDLPNRCPCVTEDIPNEFGTPISVTVSFDPRDGKPCAVFITQRGKTGTHISEMNYRMGVTINRIMQDKPCEEWIDPDDAPELTDEMAARATVYGGFS